MRRLNSYEQKLLDGWEAVYKKSQLTFWIMLALKDGPKHMAKIKQFIYQVSDATFSADDQSMYRALRRYHKADMISFNQKPGTSGPDRKVYQLTTIGENVLAEFNERNIISVFFKPSVKELLN